MKNTHDYKYLLFDLDGTLNESGEGIMKCAQHTLRHFGINIDNLNDLLPFVGPPLEDSFREFYNLNDKQIEEALVIYAKRYAELGAYEAQLFPGIIGLLADLNQTDKKVIIATSKKITMTMKVVHHFGLADYVDFVGARDDAGTRHTKADVIRHIIQEMNIADLDNMIMIGDRKFDINGAKEVGITSIGVLYGYGDRPELEAAGADYIAADIQELRDMLL